MVHRRVKDVPSSWRSDESALASHRLMDIGWMLGTRVRAVQVLDFKVGRGRAAFACGVLGQDPFLLEPLLGSQADTCSTASTTGLDTTGVPAVEDSPH